MNSPIGTLGIDIVNTSGGEKFIRSRLAARDFKENGDRREDLFAKTPPLDMLKSTLALPFRENLMVMVIDVKKARLNRVVKAGGWQSLCPGPGRAQVTGEMLDVEKWPYSMRPAARAWE